MLRLARRCGLTETLDAAPCGAPRQPRAQPRRTRCRRSGAAAAVQAVQREFDSAHTTVRCTRRAASNCREARRERGRRGARRGMQGGGGGAGARATAERGSTAAGTRRPGARARCRPLRSCGGGRRRLAGPWPNVRRRRRLRHASRLRAARGHVSWKRAGRGCARRTRCSCPRRRRRAQGGA